MRSVTISTSSAAGSVSCSFGNCALIASTVAITFAPGWRCTFRMIAGSAFTHAPSLVFSEPATTVATSVSITGRPFLYATTALLYWSALVSWSFALIVYARVGPSKLPFGVLTFRFEIVVRRSSRFIPYCASAVGFAWIRTAGRLPPDRLTRPTPAICEIFIARRVSARSCTCVSGSVFDLTASVSTGASAGFTFA